MSVKIGDTVSLRLTPRITGLRASWPGSLYVGDCSFGNALLFVARVEDRRAIAEPHIISLTIFRGRVVNLEEELEQPPIANFAGIKNDLDSFGMSSVITVGSVRDISTCVPHSRRDYAGEPSDKVLHAPEAATCEYGTFFFHRGSST